MPKAAAHFDRTEPDAPTRPLPAPTVATALEPDGGRSGIVLLVFDGAVPLGKTLLRTHGHFHHTTRWPAAAERLEALVLRLYPDGEQRLLGHIDVGVAVTPGQLVHIDAHWVARRAFVGLRHVQSGARAHIEASLGT